VALRAARRRANDAHLGFDQIDHAERVATFLAAYGLQDTSGFLEALAHVKAREATYARFWRLDPAAAAEHLDRLASQLRWLAAAQPGLERALAGH
jgi:hypothetical protein